MSDTMERKQQQRASFEQFCRGERSLYCIASLAAPESLDSFAFRTMPAEARQILAWADPAEAEQWRVNNKLAESLVVELTYPVLRAGVEALPAELQSTYSIEVI